MGQIKLTVSLVFIGLFTFAIINFAILFAGDNSAAISVADDPELVLLESQTEGNVSDLTQGDSQDTYQSIVDTTISPAAGTAQSAAPFAITPGNALFVVRNILKSGYLKIFGTGAGFGVFLSALLGMITFMIGLYVYKTLRGLPD